MALAAEPVNAMVDFTGLLLSPVYYGVGVPRGDGSRVLLLPGMLGSDGYLFPLAGWLRRVGYQPVLLGGGPSVGSLPDLLEQVERRTERLAASGRPLTLLGHSLGGMLARLTAGSHPDRVARVVTLGCPVSGDRSAGNPVVVELSRSLLSGQDDVFTARCRLPLPASVQVTSIYSRQDAVVDWHACVDPAPNATNLQVPGSHVGLTWNAAVYRHLAERLAC